MNLVVKARERKRKETKKEKVMGNQEREEEKTQRNFEWEDHLAEEGKVSVFKFALFTPMGLVVTWLLSDNNHCKEAFGKRKLTMVACFNGKQAKPSQGKISKEFLKL